MPHINILSPHVADLIAAGEVVERPASAVKELLENAFDAGARTVVVEIRAGGRELIRVTDDGCGMSPEDAGVCFLRHATSKLSDERGLEAIGTLGFRGEALAAIASVSRITLTTRERGAAVGVRMELNAGEIESMEETGCPEGTTIRVRDLFFNTPARQKFLSSDRSETAGCVQAALRCALGRPEVSVRCLRDGQEEFFSPGDGRVDSAVYALLGRDFAAGLKPVDTENEGVGVTGFVSDPGHCRGNRSGQYFFVNGRSIRSRTMQAALEQAYKNLAMVGKFPACVLYITLPNGLVDVNVHPTKAEVKFAREKAVFDGVYYGALAALGVNAPQIMTPEAPAKVPGAGAVGAYSAPKKDFFRSMDAAEFKKRYTPPPRTPSEHKMVRDGVPYRAEYEPGRIRSVPAVTPPGPPAKESAPADQTVLDRSFRTEPIRCIGEALGTYILLERGDKLCVVDKHAAHERILFDKMRLNEKPLMSQELLLPLTFTTDPEGARIIRQEKELLARLGFELEGYGEDAFAVRAVPADIDQAAAVPLLEELVEKLREGQSLSAADVWERLAATVACKAAVKAGMQLDERELMALAERVLSGEVTHCPHGRPVMQVFTRAELDKRFGRIQ
jgi:DNA mismatch repair protein MutL